LKLGTREFESFGVLFLDNRHRVIEFVELFRRAIDSASVHPRKVVKEALARNAAAVILARPHLGGLAEPSVADEQITRCLVDALQLVRIRVLDHFVVAAGEVVSFATRELIERGIAAAGKDAKETQMILNHKAAIELLVESAEDIGVNRCTVTNLHALLADNLLRDSRNVGRLRDTPVAIGSSTYVPTAIPRLIEEMFARLLELGAAVRDPFEQSFFLLVHIPYLQPFIDVNKRTSRLASNIPLIKRNLVPLSFIDVPEQTYIDGLIGVYELNRVELLRDVFVWTYERSSRRYKTVRDSLSEPDPFRLKYRTALTEVVGEVVRRRLPPTVDTVIELSRALVPANDLEPFAQLALAELNGLHEGSIARFKLRPAEFRLWTGK
jgi:RadC-like JAB domain/Fic/DOC family